MTFSKKFLVAVTAIYGALALSGGIAYATSGTSDPSIGTIRVVEPCTAAQAHANHGRGALGEHDGAFYRCRETAPDCFQWVWQYDGRPKSGHNWSTRPCPACSPSPSKPASPSVGTSPAASQSPSPSASTLPAPHDSTPDVSSPTPLTSTTPVAVQLPVTGDSTTGYLIGISALLIGAGGLLYAAASFRRRRTN